MAYKFYRIIILCTVALSICLQNNAFCTVPTDSDAKALAEEGEVLFGRLKVVNDSIGVVADKIRNENKEEKSLSRRFVGSLNVMLALGYVRTALMYTNSVYKAESICMKMSIVNSYDFVASSHVQDAKIALMYVDNMLNGMQHELLWLDGRDCQADIKPILENIQAINKDWPPNVLNKYDSSATAIEVKLTNPFQLFVVQSNAFTNDIYAYSVDLGKAMQQYNSDLPNLVGVMDLFWGCQMALNKVAECVEWASICNLTHTHSSMAGFGEMNVKAMNELARGVRSVTQWKNIFEKRAADNGSFLKPSDAERYTRAFDAWRNALTEALASDGLVLPEAGTSSAGK